MARPRHPHPDIEAAIKVAEELGWTVRLSRGHAWGRLLCPHHTPDGCAVSVWSTPKNPFRHGQDIRRAVARCGHCH